MSEIYTPDYFIEFFAKIPDEKWITGVYRRDDGCACAMGHLGGDKDILRNKAELALNDMFIKHLGEYAEDINDSKSFNGDGPKQRILKALNLIKEKMANER